MRYLQRAMEGNVALLHPKLELGMLASAEKVRYTVEKVREGEDGEGRLSCGVWVGERELVRVGGGISVMEVQTRGAEEAVCILKRERAKVAEKGDHGIERSQSRTNLSDSDDDMEDIDGSDKESMAYETASEM